MSFFSENFWYVIILAITLSSLISIYYWNTDKKERIKSIITYFGAFISMAILFRIYENTFLLKFLSPVFIILIELEFFLILIILCVNLYIFQRNFRSNLILYLHSVMILLVSHIYIVGLPGMFFTGTLTILMIGAVISIIIIPFDEEYKLIAFFIGLSLFFYISIIVDVFVLASLMLCLVSFTIAISNESFRNRIVSFYQTTVLKLKKTKIYRVNSVKIKEKLGLELKEDKKNKILFWHARVKIFQGVLSKNIEYGNEKKESEKTWLKDFFSDKHSYGLELKSDKDFRWTFFF